MKDALAHSLWRALERVFGLFDRSIACFGREVACVTIAGPGDIQIILSHPALSENSAYGYWMGRIFNEVLQDPELVTELLNRVHQRDIDAQAGVSQPE